MKSDEQILNELARAVEGLFYMSESDYPFQTVIVEGLTPALLRETAGAAVGARVETRDPDDFFARASAVRMSPGAGGRAEPASLHDLLRVLRMNLKDVRVYRVGEVQIRAYVLGKAPSGSWLGLSTILVET